MPPKLNHGKRCPCCGGEVLIDSAVPVMDVDPPIYAAYCVACKKEFMLSDWDT